MLPPTLTRRRASVRRAAWLAGASALAALLIGFAWLGPATDAWAQFPARRPVWDDDPSQRLRLLLLQSVIVAYAFALGATLGSFLNVVVYRLPLGLNIARPRSRCPCCGTPIELRDNIPVLSWLRLRGRCRICGVSIAPRYVLVETAVGLLFVGLVVVQVLSGGANLPLRTPNSLDNLFALNWGAAGELAAMSLLHATLLTTLLAAALIQFDRQRVPAALWKAALAIGLLFPAVWPHLRPVPWIKQWAPAVSSGNPSFLHSGSHRGTSLRDVPHVAERRATLAARPWWSGITDGVAGLWVGAFLGQTLSLAVSRRGRFPQARHAMLASLALVGACLGWQAAFSVAALSAVCWLLSAMLGRAWPAMNSLPPLLWPALGSLVQIVCWKRLAEFPLWPGPFAIAIHLGLWALAIVLLSVATRIVTPAPVRYTDAVSPVPWPNPDPAR